MAREQNPDACLSLEEPSLGLFGIAIAEKLEVDADHADMLGLLESHVFPALAAVTTAINAVAITDMAATHSMLIDSGFVVPGDAACSDLQYRLDVDDPATGDAITTVAAGTPADARASRSRTRYRLLCAHPCPRSSILRSNHSPAPSRG